jgi:hypothetical protein
VVGHRSDWLKVTFQQAAGPTGSRDNLVQNMRGQALLLCAMYRKLWLGDFLPYYRESILARHDEELGRLEGVANRIDRSAGNYDRHVLPPLIEPSEPVAGGRTAH